MKKSLLALILCLMISAGYTAKAAIGTTLLSDDFNGASIDTSKWWVGPVEGSRTNGVVAKGNTDPNVSLTDLGGGDKALTFTYDNNWVWGSDQVYALPSYNRGQNIRVTYKVWHTAAQPKSGDCMGPWWNAPITVGYSNHEATIISDYPTVYGGPPFKLEENPANGGQWKGTPLPLYNAAWNSAVDKASAITVRVTLGDTKGSLTEISTGGNPFQTDLDTRNTTPLGQSATGLHIGFCQIQSGGTVGAQVFVDDVSVEIDGTPPPTPTATPGPNPGQKVVLLVTDKAIAAPNDAGDKAIKSWLESQGAFVNWVDDNDVHLSDANGASLVVISSSIASANVAAKFTDFPGGVRKKE